MGVSDESKKLRRESFGSSNPSIIYNKFTNSKNSFLVFIFIL